MDYETAYKGMMDARKKLQTREGIISLPEMSENMQRLAAYTSAVEEHLAEMERSYDVREAVFYHEAMNEKGSSPTASEREAKYYMAGEKGDIKQLVRLVNSSWRLIDVTRSRFNHLDKENKGQI